MGVDIFGDNDAHLMHTFRQREVMGGPKRRGIIAVIRGKKADVLHSDSYLIRKSLYAYRVRHGIKNVCSGWNVISSRGNRGNADRHPFVVWSLEHGWSRGKCLVNKLGNQEALSPSNAAWCFLAVKRSDGNVEIVR